MNPRANSDGDTRSVARAVGGTKPSTAAAQRALRSSTPMSEGELSAATDSECDFAEGRGPRVTEAEGLVVVDLKQLCTNDLGRSLPDWWASNVQQYHGRRVIEIVVECGFEHAVMRALEMMPSKPTVEIEEEGMLFVKLQGDYKSTAFNSLLGQFVGWAGPGCHVVTEVDQQFGRVAEVKHDINCFGETPPNAERRNPASPPYLRVANMPGEIVYAEDSGDVNRALDKAWKMCDRAQGAAGAQGVFFNADGSKKSFADYKSTSQSSEMAHMYPFVFTVIALPKDGPHTPELRERLGATDSSNLRELAASVASDNVSRKVARRSTGSNIADARAAAATAAEAAYDAWTQTPGYAAAVAKNAAAKDAIALRKKYNIRKASHEIGDIPNLPDDPFPIPAAVLGARPGADLNARLRIDCRPSKYVEEGKDKYDYPQAADAPWIGLFRYDQPFTEGKYYRCVPGETLYVPVPGVVLGRDGDTNGLGNAADGGYGHHVFPLRFDELLAEVYDL
mmetsp:Transcript_29152/g.89152  ORF Transcript_29152/g.89152 Transcript_29152/m.89152 type:complete len:507 (+) Transcript_29152:132-1652(+)